MTDLSAVADQLTIGTRLGPYEIVGFIGQGGMGQVYRARDTRLDRIVAVKILPGDSSGDPRRRERFMREAWMLSSLNHPHISAIHDIGEHAGPSVPRDGVRRRRAARRASRETPAQRDRCGDAWAARLPTRSMPHTAAASCTAT